MYPIPRNDQETYVQIEDATRRFADEVIRPQAEALDHEERFPADIYAQMGELGLFGITVAEEYGGAGLDAYAYSIVMEELSRGYASVADQCGVVELIGTLLTRYGSDAQKRAWLPDVVTARKLVAYCITEAEAGSDVSGIRTTARRNGDGWVLNGSKIWIHNALNFDDVELGPEALLGEEGRGFHMMMSVLEKGRIGIAALAVGIAQAGLEAALEYSQVRKQFGKAISDNQGIQWMLADMAKDITAARALVHRAAIMLDNGLPANGACSMAKCFAGDVAVAQTANAVQIFGGSGFIRGFEVERLYRDAKICQIYEGTQQIQRTVIARELLKNGARA